MGSGGTRFGSVGGGWGEGGGGGPFPPPAHGAGSYLFGPRGPVMAGATPCYAGDAAFSPLPPSTRVVFRAAVTAARLSARVRAPSIALGPLVDWPAPPSTCLLGAAPFQLPTPPPFLLLPPSPGGRRDTGPMGLLGARSRTHRQAIASPPFRLSGNDRSPGGGRSGRRAPPPALPQEAG